MPRGLGSEGGARAADFLAQRWHLAGDRGVSAEARFLLEKPACCLVAVCLWPPPPWPDPGSQMRFLDFEPRPQHLNGSSGSQHTLHNHLCSPVSPSPLLSLTVQTTDQDKCLSHPEGAARHKAHLSLLVIPESTEVLPVSWTGSI